MPVPAKVKEITCDSIEAAGFRLGHKLGEGRFSEVVHGTNIKTGEEFAVKVVDQQALEEDGEASAALHIEVEVLKRAARHPHVVALHAVIRTPIATYLVMEIMHGGELFDAIIARGSFPEAEARLLLRQLLSALAYCHSLGVVHRDLKPENVLFEAAGKTGGADGSLKIIDFGYAALHHPGERLRGLSGTPDYVAPEVLSWYEGDEPAEGESPGGAPPPEPPPQLEYDSSCDMWSIGVILYILLCGFPPFYAEGEAELIARVREGTYEFTSPYWDDISDEAKDLIARCLSLNPDERPTPTQALTHTWVADGGKGFVTLGAMQPPAAAPAQAVPVVQARPAAAAPPPAEAAFVEEPAEEEEEEEVAPVQARKVAQQPPPAYEQEWPPPPPATAPAAARPASSTTSAAPVAASTSLDKGELIARIRQMRRAYAPHARAGAGSSSSGSGGGGSGSGAQPMQLTLDSDGTKFASAPSRAELEKQGATFVKLPKALFQDIYALCDAHRRGELADGGERPLHEMLQALTSEVQKGALGKPA